MNYQFILLLCLVLTTLVNNFGGAVTAITQTVKVILAHVMVCNGDWEDTYSKIIVQWQAASGGGMWLRKEPATHLAAKSKQVMHASSPQRSEQGVNLKDDSLGTFAITLVSPLRYFLPLHSWCVPFALTVVLWHWSHMMLKVNLLVLNVSASERLCWMQDRVFMKCLPCGGLQNPFSYVLFHSIVFN